jgi:putative phage-type endonuclease
MTNPARTQPEVISPPSWAAGPATEVLPYGAPRDAWHATRLSGIGGSDALAALNLSPFGTPYTLWLDKSGRRPPKPAVGRMAWGNRMEPVAADWFAELHDKRLGMTGTWRHPVPLFDKIRPDGSRAVWWALCNPDRYVIDEDAGVETKTVSSNAPDAKLWAQGIVPDYPQAQAQWCMGVTGAAGWWVVAMVDGCDEPVVEYVPRDEELIFDLREAAAELIRDHLYPDVAPPADARPATTEAQAAAALARKKDEVEVEIGDDGHKLLVRRREIKARMSADERELREVQNELRARLVDVGAEYGLYGGRRVVRLKKCERRAYSVAAGKYVEMREVKA